MNTISLRPGRPMDADAVFAAEKVCFRFPWTYEDIKNDLANPISRYLLMFDGDALIGYGAFWLLMEEAHITNVAIVPEYRGQGLGKRLMRALIQLAADSGAGFMELECRASNDVARKMYHTLGFLRVGYKKGYYVDTGEDAVVMALICMPPANEAQDPFLIQE